MRSIQTIAIDLRQCALSHDPKCCMVGNVTAEEVVRVCSSIVFKGLCKEDKEQKEAGKRKGRIRKYAVRP